MAGLGETTAGLARMRRAMSASQDSLGDAGMREVRGFGFNPGGLRMLAYAPPNLGPNAPLVVVLHGCTQRAGPHARAAGWLTLAERLGFAVLAPEQDPQNNPNRCFNWFETGDIARGSGEAASIHAMIQHLARAHGLDRDRVFVTGLSAGGAMTTVLLATYPETFAAGAVVAGLPFGLAGNIQEALSAMRTATRLSGESLGDLVARAAPAAERLPRITVWHGQADGTVAIGNGDAIARQWATVHGLPEAPTEISSRGAWTRSAWSNPDGDVLVEFNQLAGFGHGTPLATGGDDALGETAPFMLEAGVSSSLEIARFWGLAQAEKVSLADPWKPADLAPERSAAASDVGATVMASVSPHTSLEVQKIIERALTSAGLMR